MRGSARGVSTIVITLTVIAAGAVGASARDCSAARTRAPSPGNTSNVLAAVAAPSPCSVWAVGSYESFNKHHGLSQTLIEHWNGRSWRVQPSPDPRSDSADHTLTAVAGGWAVGSYGTSGRLGFRTLIEHWNGHSWRVQPSPNRGGRALDDELNGVAAASSKNAWAVGSYANSRGHIVTLVEHWNGRAWKVQPSPNRGVGDELDAVAAVSKNDAWAVGSFLTNPGVEETLVEHWNGRSWKVQPSPDPGTRHNWLYGVAAVSPSRVWAVGYHSTDGPGSRRPLIERYNGRSWKVQRTPGSVGSSSGAELVSVAADSATRAWAVGYTPTFPERTLIEHWNGRRWKVEPSSNPGSVGNELLGVAAASPSDIWAVGIHGTGGASKVLILHSGGHGWTA